MNSANNIYSLNEYLYIINSNRKVITKTADKFEKYDPSIIVDQFSIIKIDNAWKLWAYLLNEKTTLYNNN